MLGTDRPPRRPAVYSTVVVPLDGSPTAARALPPAIAVANAQHIPLTIMTVTTPAFTASVANRLREQAADAGMRYPSIELLLSARPPADPLLAAIDRRPGSLLVMTTHGSSHIGQFLGGTAESILRARTGPTLLVGPQCDVDRFKPTGRVIIPVDGSEVAEAVLPLAATWSVAFELEPEVVSVVDPDTETLLAIGGDLGAEAGVPSRAAASLQESTGIDCGWEVLHDGRPADGIVRHAADVEANLIAMSTHGRTGLGRVLLGSVATEVVHKAHCPVLFHRPAALRG